MFHVVMNLTNFESMGKISSFVFHSNDRNFSKLQDFHSGVKELNVSCSHFHFLYCLMSNNVESSMRSQTFLFFSQSKSTVLDICLRSFRGSLKRSMTCGSCLIVVVSWHGVHFPAEGWARRKSRQLVIQYSGYSVKWFISLSNSV